MVVERIIKEEKLAIDETLGADVIEVSGAIKWFDNAKGYGFLVCDDSSAQEVLIHASVLKLSGYSTISAGAFVECLARTTERGLSCMKILSVDMSQCLNPLEAPVSTREKVVATSSYERAIVKWFNTEKGFGFVSRGEGTDDIFIHMETLRRFNILQLLPGQVILVRYGQSGKGLMATEIYPDVSPQFLHNT